MKSKMLVALAILFLGTGLVQAMDGVGVDLDVTYVSKYLWRGIDLLDDQSAWQPSATLNFGDSGLSAKVWASYSGGGGNSTLSRVNATEYDYILAYDFTMMEGEACQMDVTLNYIYYDFIDEATKTADAQEMGANFAWSNLMPCGIVPSYYVGKIWPSRSDSALTGEYEGWVHVLGLSYDMAMTAMGEDQIVTLIFNAVYNDGFASAAADHDWSHLVFGAKSSFGVGPMTMTPGVYFQKSMDDSINTEDELWGSLSMSYSF